MQRFAPDRLLWYSWLRSYYFDMNHHDQARAVPRSGLFLCPVLVVMGPGVPTPNPCRALFGARYLHDLKNKHREGDHQRWHADDKGSYYFGFYMNHPL